VGEGDETACRLRADRAAGVRRRARLLLRVLEPPSASPRTAWTSVRAEQRLASRGVLRGLHYQWPNPQGKLVSVLEGEVYDVAVDIRRGSPRFGQWTGVVLSADNHRQFWIPEGFAHGFVALSERAVFTYLCTAPYDRAGRRGIRWNDAALGDRLAGRRAVAVGQGRADRAAAGRTRWSLLFAMMVAAWPPPGCCRRAASRPPPTSRGHELVVPGTYAGRRARGAVARPRCSPPCRGRWPRAATSSSSC
jgi:dTDP-4-dehydrorhamnose 3,5-epimerase-like enzyme